LKKISYREFKIRLTIPLKCCGKINIGYYDFQMMKLHGAAFYTIVSFKRCYYFYIENVSEDIYRCFLV